METATDFCQVDDAGQLFISPVIQQWPAVSAHNIDTVIDLEGGLDDGVPTTPGGCLYIYFPIYDDNLPNLARLQAVASLGAELIRGGHRVLCHCSMGFNRSALMAGAIMNRLGMPGRQIVDQLRQRRPGALFNETFAAYLNSLVSETGS